MRIMTISGRVAQDVTPQLSRQGTQFISFSLASQEYFDEKDGDGKPKVQWYKITAFDSRLIALAKHLKKGKPIVVTGDYSNRKYQSQRTGEIGIDNTIIATNINFEIGAERQENNGVVQSSVSASPQQVSAQVANAVETIPQATSRKMSAPKVNEPLSGSDDELPF